MGKESLRKAVFPDTQKEWPLVHTSDYIAKSRWG